MPGGRPKLAPALPRMNGGLLSFGGGGGGGMFPPCIDMGPAMKFGFIPLPGLGMPGGGPSAPC